MVREDTLGINRVNDQVPEGEYPMIFGATGVPGLYVDEALAEADLIMTEVSNEPEYGFTESHTYQISNHELKDLFSIRFFSTLLFD